MRLGRYAPALALAAVALAVPLGSLAEAQTATSTYNTTCDKKVSDSDQEAAHAAFILARKAYDESDYAKAIENFKEAYRLDCTKPELLSYVARAYEAKGDKAEAIAALEAYVKRAPKAPDIESVQRRIANLKQSATQPTTSATTPATTTTTTTSPTTTTTATPTATDTAPPPGGEERHHTIPPWIVVGVGGAAVVTGVILLAVGSSKVSDSFSLCPNAMCVNDPLKTKQAQATQLNSDGRTLQNVGIIVGIVGVAAVGGGLVWHFIEPTGPAKSARIRPDLGPGYVGLSGTF